MVKDAGDEGNFKANKNYLKGLRGIDDAANVDVLEEIDLSQPFDENIDSNVVELTGSVKDICKVWQIRRNFIILTIQITVSSFSYY